MPGCAAGGSKNKAIAETTPDYKLAVLFSHKLNSYYSIHPSATSNTKMDVFEEEEAEINFSKYVQNLIAEEQKRDADDVSVLANLTASSIGCHSFKLVTI
jgi:hypothetical protein